MSKSLRISVNEDMWELETTKGFITGQMLGSNYGWFLAADNNTDHANAIESELPYSDVLTIDTIEVKPRYRQKGVGTKLIQAFIKKAKRLGLDAIMLNASPMGGISYTDLVMFYRVQGFRTYKAYDQYGNQTMILDLRRTY